MSACISCGKELSYNDIGAHKKLINRGATEFYCQQCLCRKLDIPYSLLQEKIRQFKAQGCTLFV